MKVVKIKAYSILFIGFGMVGMMLQGMTTSEYEAHHMLLLSAVKSNKRVMVEQLLQDHTLNINVRDKEGKSPLHWAAEKGYIAILKKLLMITTIDINALGYFIQTTPLMEACVYGHVDIVTLLLEMPNIKLNMQDVSGNTALLLAVRRGHTDIVRLLIRHPDIEVNVGDCNRITPLMEAIEKDTQEIVRLLLTVDSLDIECCCKMHKTALMRAQEGNKPHLIALLMQFNSPRRAAGRILIKSAFKR